MDRRNMMKLSAAAGAVAVFAGASIALPPGGRVKVAFMLGNGTNVIDLSGPWEVFQDTPLPGTLGMRQAFDLYTVARSLEPIEMTGGFRALPHYDVSSAPQPNVIVVPAHRTDPALQDWLKASSAKADVTMSVCTGAFKLAEAGLLEGLAATTHHDFWDEFARKYPDIDLKRGMRFVDSGRIATAGGLTSGFDMALHVVSRYFGDDVAQATATYMEHDSKGWRDGRRAAV